MRTPILFIYKLIKSVFALIWVILYLSIYLLGHLFWYFRLPEQWKVAHLMMCDDYNAFQGDYIYKNLTERGFAEANINPPMICVWPTELHRIWNWRVKLIPIHRYKEEYLHVVYFESRVKK